MDENALFMDLREDLFERGDPRTELKPHPALVSRAFNVLELTDFGLQSSQALLDGAFFAGETIQQIF